MRNRLLAVGVLLTGLIFSISGCGGTFGNSLTKVLVGAGPYAIFFPAVASEYVGAGGGKFVLANSEFTVEAWIKTNATGGTIFSRGPAMLSVDAAGFADFTADAGTNATGTTLVNDSDWHHIAGVLSGTGHSHNGGATIGTCTGLIMNGIHVDIYVDGIWEMCAISTFPATIDTGCDNINTPEFDYCTNNIGNNILVGGPAFLGTIDEVRLWNEARSVGQIKYWRKEEISGSDWDTADPNNRIIGYWKFNEGTGDSAIDSSGYGNNGSKLLDSGQVDINGDPIFVQWLDGWVDGYPF